MAADQLTKWWAVATLRYECMPLVRQGDHPPRILRCLPDAFTVALSAPASTVAFRRGSRTLFAVSCRDGSDCLAGAVRLGEERSGTRITRLRHDPVEQALLMFRGVPLEAGHLTSGPDGQLYSVEAVGAGGRRSSLRLRYRSPARPLEVVASLFHLRYVENPGAAWGLLGDLEDGIRHPLFLLVSALAIVFLLLVLWRLRPEQRLFAAALGSIFGGAVGNLVDRVRFGWVVDFIDWHYRERVRWPTFNLADAAISIGVVLLLWGGLSAWRRERRARRQVSS